MLLFQVESPSIFLGQICKIMLYVFVDKVEYYFSWLNMVNEQVSKRLEELRLEYEKKNGKQAEPGGRAKQQPPETH